MRLQPAQTDAEEFNEAEFRRYVWNHKIVGLGEKKTFEEFIHDIFMNRTEEEKKVVIAKILTLWPLEYQAEVKEILNECAQ